MIMDFFNLKCNNPTCNMHLMINLGLSLRSWWFVWCEGKNADKTRTKFFVISGADPGIFDGG